MGYDEKLPMHSPPRYSTIAPELKGSGLPDLSQSESQVGQPIKTYQVVSTKKWSTKHIEIQHHGQPIYFVNTKHGFMKATIIHISTGSASGEIIASCKLQCWSRKLLFHLGNPDCTDPKTWPIADCEGWSEKAFSFTTPSGQRLSWRRTRSKELGASRWSNKCFKLVDQQTGKILAVHIYTQSCFGGKMKQIARVEFFEELEGETEIVALAVVHGIEERIREGEQAAAASGGGS